MNDQQTSTPRGKVTRKASLLVAALAIVGMGSMTVACTPHTDKPAETSSSVAVTPTEKSAGCSGGPGSVGDRPGCAGKHHNNNSNNQGNHGKNNRHSNGNGGGNSHTGGGNSHTGGGNSHKSGGSRGHK